MCHYESFDSLTVLPPYALETYLRYNYKILNESGEETNPTSQEGHQTP